MDKTEGIKPGTSPAGAGRWLALAAVLGPVAFTLAWLVLGSISSGYQMWDVVVPSYSPVSQPISGLGMSSTAPYMNTAFVSLGVLLILGAHGMFKNIPQLSPKARRAATVLFALPGVGAIVDGIFNLESFMLHFMGFGLVVVFAMVGFAVVGRLLRRIATWKHWGTSLMIASPVTLLLTVLYFATFNPENAGNNVGIGGLTQRILVTQILAWYALIAWRSFKLRALGRTPC